MKKNDRNHSYKGLDQIGPVKRQRMSSYRIGSRRPGGTAEALEKGLAKSRLTRKRKVKVSLAPIKF